MTSISTERSGLAKVGDGLIRREQWGARHNYTSARTVVEPAKQIFIHITVTNPNNYNSHAAHVRGIEAIGRSRFPNTGISYNRIVLFGVDRAYEAQPIGRRGAHTVNDHRRSTCNRWGAACPGNGDDLTAPSWNNNYTARAYAYGALTQHSVTDSVLDTFARAIADDINAGFIRRDAKIHGHRCLSSKSCPGDHMWARLHELRRRVDDYLEDDMPTAQEIADAVWGHRFNKTTNPDEALRASHFVALIHQNSLMGRKQSLSELAAVRAEQAAQRELLVQLAAAQTGVQLNDEQVSQLASRIAEAGQGACDQVLARLSAVGEALDGDATDA